MIYYELRWTGDTIGCAPGVSEKSVIGGARGGEERCEERSQNSHGPKLVQQQRAVKMSLRCPSLALNVENTIVYCSP